MKQMLFAGCVILLLLGMAACTQSSTSAPDPAQTLENTTQDSENTTTESPENDTTEDLENETVGDSENNDTEDNKEDFTDTIGTSQSDTDYGSVTYTIKKSEQKQLSVPEKIPEMEDYFRYMKKVADFNHAEIVGDYELWELNEVHLLDERDDWDYEINTFLITYPVLEQGSNVIVYWGVDYTRGRVFSWNPEKMFSPVKVEIPTIFNTPEEVLIYMKKFFVYTDSDLELIPGQSSDSGEDLMPYFKSKDSPSDENSNPDVDVDNWIEIGDPSDGSYSIDAYSTMIDLRYDEGHRATIGRYIVHTNGFIQNFLSFQVYIAEEAL